jgi:predicted DNA-binding transcriptional regulator AlpA
MALLKFLLKHEVLALVRLTYPTIWRMMREGTFPRSRVIGDSQKIGWLEHEVQQWIQSRPVRRLKGDRIGVPHTSALNTKIVTRVMINCKPGSQQKLLPRPMTAKRRRTRRPQADGEDGGHDC